MVTTWPATVRVAVRDAGVGLAATISATVPVPAPLAGDAVTHEALEVVLHAQPAGAEIVRFWEPPPPVTDALAGDTE
jgi:hypothetical protein